MFKTVVLRNMFLESDTFFTVTIDQFNISLLNKSIKKTDPKVLKGSIYAHIQ